MQMTQIDTAAATDAPARVTIDLATLKPAVAYLAARIIEKRNTIPILSGVLIEPCEGGARFTATDLDVMASVTVPAQWEGAGAVAVDCAKLADILKKAALPPYGATVSLAWQDRQPVKLTTGRTAQQLKALDRSQFPIIATPEGEGAAFTLSADTIARMAELVPLTSKEGLGFWRDGVNALAHDGALILLASAGGNAATWRCELPAGADALAMALRPKLVKAIDAARALGDKAAPLSWETAGLRVVVTAGPVRIVGKLIDDAAGPDVMAKLAGFIADATTPMILPDIDPYISAAAITLFDKLTGKDAVHWTSGSTASRIDRPAQPDWTGYSANLAKPDTARGGCDDVMLTVGGRDFPVGNGRGDMSLSAETVRAIQGADHFDTVAFTMPDGSKGYALKWLLDDQIARGVDTHWTVPQDGKVYGEKTAHLRHRVSIEHILGNLIDNYTPAAPVEAIAQPLRLTPDQQFRADYAAAYAARDGDTMRALITARKAVHAAEIERGTYRKGSAADYAMLAKGEVRRECTLARGDSRPAKVTRAGGESYCRYRWADFERRIYWAAQARIEAAKKAAWLTEHAPHAGDCREYLSITVTGDDGKVSKAYAKAEDLRNVNHATIALYRRSVLRWGGVSYSAKMDRRRAVTAHIDTIRVTLGANADERAAMAAKIAEWEAQQAPQDAAEGQNDAPTPATLADSPPMASDGQKIGLASDGGGQDDVPPANMMAIDERAIAPADLVAVPDVPPANLVAVNERPRVRFTAADYRARMAVVDAEPEPATPLSGDIAPDPTPLSADRPDLDRFADPMIAPDFSVNPHDYESEADFVKAAAGGRKWFVDPPSKSPVWAGWMRISPAQYRELCRIWQHSQIITPVEGQDTPLSADRPTRAPRAVRERLVRAYLRMRRERVLAMAVAEDQRHMRKNVQQALRDHRAVNLAKAGALRDKRRRAVMLARDMRNRLRSEQRHNVIGMGHLDAMRDARDEWRKQAMLWGDDLEQERARANAAEQEATDLSAALADATDRIAALNARPLHMGNTVRPDDLQRVMAERDQARAERDRERQRADASHGGIDGMERAMEGLLQRALAAENALAAVEARIQRGGQPYAVASPAVRWQKAA